MRKPTAKQVVTRGTPDMREPQGKAPFHMMQKDFGEYSHPGVIEKIKQDTALDKSARQSTIFDNTQRRQDPDRQVEEFGESTYVPPGRAFMKRATESQTPVRRPRIPFEGKGQVVSEAYRGARMDYRQGKGYSQSELASLRAKHPEYFTREGKLKEQIKAGIKKDKYKWLQEHIGKKPSTQPSTPSASSLSELAAREGSLPRDEKPVPLETLSELPPSKVRIPSSDEKPQAPSKGYRYPYNKKIVEDIKKQESGKLKVKR